MTPTQATQVARFLDELSDAVYLDEYRIAQALDADEDSDNQINSRIRGGPRSQSLRSLINSENHGSSEQGSTGGAA